MLLRQDELVCVCVCYCVSNVCHCVRTSWCVLVCVIVLVMCGTVSGRAGVCHCVGNVCHCVRTSGCVLLCE